MDRLHSDRLERIMEADDAGDLMRWLRWQLVQVPFANLADSIKSRDDATEVVVGTNIAHATTHRFDAKRGAFGTSYADNSQGAPIPWGGESIAWKCRWP